MSNHCDLIWYNGKIVPFQDATTHVMSHVLHYGSGVFEGIKCYKTPNGPGIFKLDEHIKRLFESAKIYNMHIPYTPQELSQACLELVKENQIDSGYIRPIAFYGYDTLGVHPKECPVSVSIGIFDWGSYLGENALENGVRVTVSPWRKFHSTSFPTVAKSSGQYLNSLLAVQDAKAKGFDEALLLNQEGTIAEGAGQNIFVIKNGELYTNAEDSSILMGITRETLIYLASKMDIKVHIGKLSLWQLFNADEAFFCGTASEVTPIREVDGRVIGNGKAGSFTQKLQHIYIDIVHGKIDEYVHWLTLVENLNVENTSTSFQATAVSD
ncbi:MAG: branched-chain amino acid transaminase [Candidatus Marinimicrobia bacterium]|nr:branched-chain amino acid transaminase [Candidatus Neomarinimicrobiota bacterium]